MRRLALLLMLLAAPAAAQIAPDRETLIEAARVDLTPDGRLTASGGVTVESGTTRLTAATIVYDRDEDRVTLTGPIRLVDEDGSVILADGADLDADLRTGLVVGLRVLVDRQLQIAAAELQRGGPRFDALTQAVASSCRVCAANPVPLWEIRARRVLHDRTERQIYFTGAQFRVRGVPVAYIPRLRLPAPGNDRARGFLRPSIRTTSQLGTGIKLPYFVPLGPTRDVTLTPYVAPGTRTVELRYRQAFGRGALTVDGALSGDDILPDRTRGYVFAQGTYALGRTRLAFDVEEVSDGAYLLDYGITSRDLLRREVRAERVDPNRLIAGRLTEYERLRAPERRETAPNRQAALRWARRAPGLWGGIGFAEADLLSYARRSGRATDGPDDPDALPDGRDVTRLSARLGWQGRSVTASGVEAVALARLDLQSYAIADDAAFPGSVSRAVPVAAARLAWPLRRVGAGGTDILTPRVQVLWRGDAADAPLEEGTRPEFDAGNLFALSRLPGEDGDAPGLRADLGLDWTRYGPGYEAGVLLGRSVRDRDPGVFAPGSGLDGGASDWLAESWLRTARARFDARALVGDDGALTRAEARLGYEAAAAALSAGYVFQSAAIQSDGIERARVSELDLVSSARLRRGLEADLALRYDLDARRPRDADIGLTVEGDCARARVTAGRRFSSAGGLSRETRFGLSVELTGIGGAPRRGSSACGPG